MSGSDPVREVEVLARAIAKAEHYRCNEMVHGFTSAEIQELGEIREVFARNDLTPEKGLIARFVFGSLEPIPSDEVLLQGFPV